jgi:CubicO group peptidase (beta-lactamase class C family)
MELSSKTMSLIKKACKGKTHIKLTIGYLTGGKKTIKVFDESGEIQNDNYIYEIASISKTFTASLMAKYIHENKMSLDDSIQKYFGGLDCSKYYPTLKRLATHTAGYSMALPLSWREFLMTPITGFPALPNVDEIKAVLLKNNRRNKDYPWVYSNYGFVLIGHALGVISGKGYWDAMDEFLSTELGLPNTYTGTLPEKNLHGFNRKNENCGNFVFDKSPNIPSGDGEISASAEDLLTYAQLNINDEKPYLPLCHKKYANVSSMVSLIFRIIGGVEKIDMGLGWMLNKDNNDILWHIGDLGPFSSYLSIDKDMKLASVVLSNYKLNTIKIGLSILEGLQKHA